MLNSRYLTTIKTPTKPAVLLLGSQMEEDGIQSALLHQARWFYGRGYRVVAAFLGDPDGLHGRWQARLPVPLVNLKAIQPNENPFSALFRWIHAVIRASRMFAIGEFGIIQTYGALANLFGLPLARLAGVAVRVGNYPAQTLAPVMHKAHSTVIKSCASHMVAATEYIQKHALQEGIQPERLVLIRSGVQPAEEIDLQLRRRLRVELDVPDDGCLVVSAGGMHSPQAYHDLLQVVPGILEEFPLTRFVFVGKGPAHTSQVQIARQLGVAAQVRFPGARSDLLRLIGAADVYVLPSAIEGIPPYLLEAMAAQRAIVASDCEQVKEFIQPGSTALTAAPGDLLSLKNAIIQLISDAELRIQIGNSAQEWMRSQYNLERMCREYAVLLDPSYHVEAL